MTWAGAMNMRIGLGDTVNTSRATTGPILICNEDVMMQKGGGITAPSLAALAQVTDQLAIILLRLRRQFLIILSYQMSSLGKFINQTTVRILS